MSEQDQDVMTALLSGNLQFKRLFDKHHSLNSLVDDANHDSHVGDYFEIEEMKKERLLLKDRMATIIHQYHHTNRELIHKSNSNI